MSQHHRDHVPSPTSGSDENGHDNGIADSIRDLHGDYDYGDHAAGTATATAAIAATAATATAAVSGSKGGKQMNGGERGVTEAKENDDDNEEDCTRVEDAVCEGEVGGEAEEVGGEEGGESEDDGAPIDPAEELRAREDKAAMDRLVVAMAGEGVVVWRHQSGFHKELVRSLS